MKKILSLLLSAAMAATMSVAAFAASSNDFGEAVFEGVWDDDDEAVDDFTLTGGEINGEDVTPGQTLYFIIEDGKIGTDPAVNTSDLKDSDLFKFDYDKDTNGKMISSIKLLTDKKVAGQDRADLVLEIVLADTTTTSEIHTDGEITFKAKRDSGSDDSKYDYSSDANYEKDDMLVIPYSFWINNEKAENDDNPDTGDRVYFSPDENENNTLIWGDDRAALEFEADDDASDFYARLSTSVDRDLYAEYGDPVDAELYFYDFVGNPTVPSTSRATLTLGIPWDEDDDYVPDPETCFIYERDADGYLVDVTDKFTYSEDDQEIAGWSMKTRTLGTYVISDTELDIDSYNDDEEADVSNDDIASDDTSDVTDTDKVIPQTGSSDMVNVAVFGAVVSLAAASALAFRKVSK
ncbi:LPXTG cell wall anchor domain-containing protein [Anaerotruncus sp. AF02-27]|uniref:LPXTG cell wall anchor domain-containing protein n=1 Tax=Anaerotruncus TaxID=244127 RepID=UPI000E53EBDE|nr:MULTISPECIES: LPXTG cell wall anchor domain-containing protein [Anaerotruncus]RGX54280.1 LPXTG cell wall anchor domain-containing protein [Anaerotruncus sp. AF02-27]